MVVPLVKRIHAANTPDELRVIALTGMIGSDTEDTPLEKAQELGIEYALALTAMFGEWTPYLNMNKMPGLTYAYVIGRSGGVVWAGDPSRDGEEFLEALSAALTAVRARVLPGALDSELSDAVGAYVRADFKKARKLADKAIKRFSKKKGADAQRIAGQAVTLTELVEGTLLDLSAAFEQAWEARDAAACALTARALQGAFPKSDAAAGVRARLAGDAAFEGSVEAWSTWLELRDARPPSFPVGRDKLGTRYAKSLAKYLKKNADGPGAERAGAWLERYRGEQ